jgi:hypothetical protein
MPYGSARTSALRDLRCAAEVGLEGEVLQSIAGGQLQRIVDGEEPADFGPAPGGGGLGPRDLARERAISYLATACYTIYRGNDPVEPLSLALLAVRYMDGPDARDAAPLIEYALEHAGEHLAGAPAAVAAQLVLGTPRAVA